MARRFSVLPPAENEFEMPRAGFVEPFLQASIGSLPGSANSHYGSINEVAWLV